MNVYLRLNGKLFAQYTIGSPRTQFIHADHLGSTRLLTTMAQSVADSLDYLPFGEQISGATGTTHKFTGKERDSESGLDHFQFRNFGSTMGRWMSPDPINLTARRLVNPGNTLNKYVYGGNNPLLYVDPTGQDITLFYRAPGGGPRDEGHVLLAVTNQATGHTRFADYYPKNGNKDTFLCVPGALHDPSSDRLKEHAALTIQIASTTFTFFTCSQINKEIRNHREPAQQSKVQTVQRLTVSTDLERASGTCITRRDNNPGQGIDRVNVTRQ
jgi:RHS repeat-associated protein